MSISIDISKGVDPVPVSSDIRTGMYYARAEGKNFKFESLPFTTFLIGNRPYADKALVLKHGRKEKERQD